MSEFYAEDDSTVTVWPANRHGRRKIACDCGAFRDDAFSESEANEKAMAHVLAHDIAYAEDEAEWELMEGR